MNFVSYILYRSTEEDFTPDETTHIARGALETQKDKTEYDDTGLTAATTYYYVLQTTHDGQTTEARTSLTTPDAGTPELSFEGLARSCAGGIGADGVHDFTIIGTLKDEDGVIMANTPLKFSFEGNKGEVYRARYIPDVVKSQAEVPDSEQEEMTATSDAEGKVSVHVLSSDTVSTNIKIKAKWTNAQGDEKEVGDKACTFAASVSLRRFGLVNFPNEEDTGWIFNNDILLTNGITPAKVYLKFQIDPSIPRDTKYFSDDGTPLNGDQMSDRGNWKDVNLHKLKIRIDDIKLQEGAVFSGTTGDYATLIDENNDPVETIEALTNNGAAQIYVKTGDLFQDIDEVVLSFEDETEK